jgi:hypothetical protein
MSAFRINDNPFVLVVIILPLLTFIVSLIGQLIMKRKAIILSVVFIIYLIATFTLFNSTFLIWCFVYTFISLFGTLFADLILKFKKISTG